MTTTFLEEACAITCTWELGSIFIAETITPKQQINKSKAFAIKLLAIKVALLAIMKNNLIIA